MNARFTAFEAIELSGKSSGLRGATRSRGPGMRSSDRPRWLKVQHCSWLAPQRLQRVEDHRKPLAPASAGREAGFEVGQPQRASAVGHHVSHRLDLLGEAGRPGAPCHRHRCGLVGIVVASDLEHRRVDNSLPCGAALLELGPQPAHGADGFLGSALGVECHPLPKPPMLCILQRFSEIIRQVQQSVSRPIGL